MAGATSRWQFNVCGCLLRHKVSLNRPLIVRQYRAVNMPLNSEYMGTAVALAYAQAELWCRVVAGIHSFDFLSGKATTWRTLAVPILTRGRKGCCRIKLSSQSVMMRLVLCRHRLAYRHPTMVLCFILQYWSQAQRRAITAARDAGVHLGFFSGNTAYWRIRWESSPVDGTHLRTMVVYKDSQVRAGASRCGEHSRINLPSSERRQARPYSKRVDGNVS